MSDFKVDLLRNNLDFFIGKVQTHLREYGYAVDSDPVNFDEYISPTIEYGGDGNFENPLIMDLYYKFQGRFGEENAYDELKIFVETTDTLKIFNERFGEKFTQTADEEAKAFNLLTFYFSIVQEYVDVSGTLDSFVYGEIDNERLSSIYQTYVNFMISESTDIKIIIPITAAHWFDPDDSTELNLDFGNGIRLRNMTTEEQIGRLFVSVRQDVFYFDDRQKNIDQVTNLVLEISETVRLKNNKIVDIPDKVRTKFQKKFYEINSLLTLISLEFSYPLIGFHRVYYKIEGYPFNAHSTPLVQWHDLFVKSSSLPRFLDLEFGRVEREDYLILNKDRLAPVNNMYQKICSSHSDHREKIEGALFRRTRALMDFSETEGLLDSVIGIEQILNDSHNDISFKMSLYIANLLQDDKEFETKSKKEIFNEFKEIYKKRSRIVHRGISVSEREALKYLERLIVRILSHPKIDLQSKQTITSQIEDIYLFE